MDYLDYSQEHVVEERMLREREEKINERNCTKWKRTQGQ
jgi:hypothetical protein